MQGFRHNRFSPLVAVMALASSLLGGVGGIVATASPAAAVATTPPGYTALVPVRICDTRAANAGVVANQCDTGGHSPLGTGSVLNVTVAGVFGVPADATGVVLHVTATGTQAASYLTVWPTGLAQPTVATVNWTPGQTVSNLTQVGVFSGGQVSVFNYAFAVDVVIDLQGYVEASSGSLFTPLPPIRVCDTRQALPANQCNAGGTAPGAIGGGQTRTINVASGFGVPVGATAVVLNMTATTTSTSSYLTVWPTGAAQPLAASLNWAPGQTISNRVITPIDASGNINVFNAYGSTDVVIDLSGYYIATITGSGFFPFSPGRICDTRPIGPGVGSNACNNSGQGPLLSGFLFSLSFNPPPAMTAIVVNVTVVDTGAAGYLTVFPDDDPNIPLAADLTWAPGQVVGNFTVADLGATATMAVFNGSSASTDVVIDAVGYYSTSPTGASPRAVNSLFKSITAKRSAHHK